MRSHIYCRYLRPDEADLAAFRSALEANPTRGFPKDVFSLPTTRVMVAEKREEHGVEIIGYQPHYLSLVMGSWVPSEGVTEREAASAMHMLTAAAYTRANTESLADILIHSNTAETIAYALRHGYVKTHDTLRLEIR